MPTREKGAARNGGQPDPEVSSLPLFEPPTPTDLSACATYQSLVDMKQSKRGAVASTGTRGNDLIAPRQRHLSTPLLTPLATPTPQPIRKGLRPRCSGLEPIAVARKGGADANAKSWLGEKEVGLATWPAAGSQESHTRSLSRSGYLSATTTYALRC